MFQQKPDNLFRVLPNVFGVAAYILIVGYDADSTVHDRTLRHVMQIYHQESLKLDKKKCHFRCIKIQIFGIVIFREVVQPDTKEAAYIK